MVPNAVVRTVIGTLRDIAPITPRLVEIASTLDEARTQVNQHLLADKHIPSPGG